MESACHYTEAVWGRRERDVKFHLHMLRPALYTVTCQQGRIGAQPNALHCDPLQIAKVLAPLSQQPCCCGLHASSMTALSELTAEHRDACTAAPTSMPHFQTLLQLGSDCWFQRGRPQRMQQHTDPLPCEGFVDCRALMPGRGHGCPMMLQ